MIDILLNLILFCFILGLIVTIHEAGHFFFAKKVGIYVYEFSIGMGPKLFGWKRKNDETSYSIRLLPIGGYVHIAGEDVEEDNDIPKDKLLNNKTVFQRFLVMTAGVFNNFMLAIVLLLISGFIYGVPETKPVVNDLIEDYPAYDVIKIGEEITEINGKRTPTWDDVILDLQLVEKGKTIDLKLKDKDGNYRNVKIQPKEIKNEETGKTEYKIGIYNSAKKVRGFVEVIKYTGIKFYTTIKTMIKVLGALFTGKIGLGSLSGPVGIYNVVGQQAKAGIENIISLIVMLTINVGFINILPFPAFDGGKVLFLIIEKIRKKPVTPKIENTIHTIGFVILMTLMLVITVNDIFHIF